MSSEREKKRTKKFEEEEKKRKRRKEKERKRKIDSLDPGGHGLSHFEEDFLQIRRSGYLVLEVENKE